MLKKRFTPHLQMRQECTNDTGNVLTVLKLDSLHKYVDEFEESTKLLADPNKIIKLTVDALLLFYCWNRDFIEWGLPGLPRSEDLNTNAEVEAREALVECIIKSMHDVDRFHPELRAICTNVTSVSVVRVQRSIILLSLNVNNGSIH